MSKQERPNESGHRAATDTEWPNPQDRPPATAPGTVHRLWLTRAQALEALGCSARTLRRRAQSGEVERRREGVHTLYRIPGLDTGQSGQNPKTGQKMAAVSRVATAPSRAANPPEVAAVRVLVERLEEQTIELAELRRDNAALRGGLDSSPAPLPGLEGRVAQLEAELEAARELHRADLKRWRARIGRWKRRYVTPKSKG